MGLCETVKNLREDGSATIRAWQADDAYGAMGMSIDS